MSSGIFFVVSGVIIIVLWSGVIPRIDRFIARSRPESLRRNEGWRRFQTTNSKQGVVFGAFLVLLGIVAILTR